MSKIAFALDVFLKEDTKKFINLLEPHVGAFKVGLENFISTGEIPETYLPIILDLKLHDIPTTVWRAIEAACRRSKNIKYITLHVQQRETLRQAVEVAKEHGITLLGITVLTSMTHTDIDDLQLRLYDDLDDSFKVSARVDALTHFGAECGLNGFVCSPHEISTLRDWFNGFLLVPGVRPLGSNAGDQKRIGTPSQAIKDGASMIVIGRSIRDAKDPVAAAKKINTEIESQILEKEIKNEQ